MSVTQNAHYQQLTEITNDTEAAAFGEQLRTEGFTAVRRLLDEFRLTTLRRFTDSEGERALLTPSASSYRRSPSPVELARPGLIYGRNLIGLFEQRSICSNRLLLRIGMGNGRFCWIIPILIRISPCIRLYPSWNPSICSLTSGRI